MLAPDARVVAIDLLRPPAGGFQLDQAVLTTYSLDLETLLALPLAVLAHSDQGIDALLADPLLLIGALQEAGSKLHVFVDENAMAVPRSNRELYSLLEPCVHPVRAPHGGAFHPKVWIARFVKDKANENAEVCLRVAVLSRNLTFDRSWDLALASESSPSSKRSEASAALATLMRKVPELSQVPLPAEVLAVTESLAEQLGRTIFPSPEGFEGPVRFHTLGLDAKRSSWPPMGSGRRVLAIAPFLKRSPLDILRGAVRDGTRTLIARQDQLDKLPDGTLDDWTEVLVLADAAHEELEDGISSRLSGLHGKAIAIEHGWNVTWWIGSANLTDAAWHGANVEVMAEVSGKKGRKGSTRGQGISQFLESGFRAICQEYRRSEPKLEAEGVAADRKALTQARERLIQAELTLVCTPSDDGWSWTISGDLALPDRVQAEIWPVSVPEKDARALDLPLQWLLPVARLTAFVAFRLWIPKSGLDAERFIRKLPASGMPEGRINHVLRDLISSPERLLRFLRALLGGLEGLVEWSQAQENGSGGVWGTGLGGETLLEDLLRAASRDPSRLEPIRRILEDLNATEEGQKILPAGLMETWNAVQKAVSESSE